MMVAVSWWLRVSVGVGKAWMGAVNPLDGEGVLFENERFLR